MSTFSGVSEGDVRSSISASLNLNLNLNLSAYQWT